MQRRVPSEIESAERRFNVWLEQYHNAEMVRQAEVLPLRRDMITLITFVRDNKAVGMQSTGNVPLEAVRETTTRFVTPPEPDSTIGNHAYKLRSEADVWPLYFLHILAEVGGLLAITPARRWWLTAEGEIFLGAAPLFQVSFLLTVWWYEVNWLLAYPFEGMGDALPPSFNLVTLSHLRSLSTGSATSFEDFADMLIEKTGLTWTAPDSSFATTLLRGSVTRMVIDVLADFGGAKREYQEEPLGKALLDAVAIVSG